ncbi:MAG: MurR/RpiR family transcriptional regulator [Lachnospiraceae bacterium]|jgi:RpiR family carbohydrate utilization transcriptional regulator|nr:MurR/RpiR family transcriptional regulator [Lachnospiraceae bacterium]
MENTGSVIEIIKEKYQKIYTAERKVADFVLDRPQEAVNMNVAELAKQSDVSEATVIRLCHHLGYSGYYQFRILLAKEVGNSQPDTEELDQPNAIQGIFQKYSQSIREIGENIDQEAMRSCAEMIKNCNQAYIIAVGNTMPLALYMSFRLMRIGVRCFTDMGPEYFLNHINLGSSDDIVVAISQSGSSKQVIEGIKLGKEKGMKAIAITAFANSEVSEISDYALISTGRKESFNYYKNYAHLKETAVIDALLELITNWETIVEKQTDRPEMILAETKY